MEEIKTLAQVEKEHILQTLQILKGDKLRTARVLGVGKTTVYRKLRQWGISANFGMEVAE